jgi:hypothetical protein
MSDSTPTSPPAIPIIFINQTSNTVWVQFLNGVFGSGQTGANGAVALSGNTAYNLADLSSTVPGFPELGKVPNVSLSDFTNGSTYFNFGSAGLQGYYAGYQPNPTASSDPNYGTRYAFVEMNVFGGESNNLDLTAISWFSIPIEVSTWRDGKMVGQLTCSSGGDIIQALAPLSTGVQAFVPQATPTAPYTAFARIIAPGLVDAYPDWTSYMDYLAGLSYSTNLAGQFGGSGSTNLTEAQSYAMTVTFDSSTQMVTITGTTGVAGDMTITVSYADLNALTGVYGTNPPYTVTLAGSPPVVIDNPGIVNDVTGWIMGDLLAGMNMGFLGSATLCPGTTTPLGQCTSSEWFAAAQQDPSLQFSGAQSNSSYYNTYAAALLPLMDGYGFPFSDRVSQPLLYFPPPGTTGAVDYLQITILAD